MKTALAYIRCSTLEQATEGLSLDSQRHQIKLYCALRDFRCVAWFEDAGVSGSKPLANRPAGGKLTEALRSGVAQAIICTKLDRAFRDAVDAMQTTRAWDRKGFSLHILDMGGGNAIDTRSAAGKFMLAVMSSLAEMERNLIRERTAAALALKRSRNEYTGGEPPYGYRVGDDGKHLVKNQEEMEAQLWARAYRSRGMSLRAIGLELKSAGLNPRGGGRWHAETVKARMERCRWPRCRGTPSITYLGIDLCDKHWEMVASEDSKVAKRARAKLKLPARNQGRRDDEQV